jgi:hypothetical protein
MCFLKKITQCIAQPIFDKIGTLLFQWKVAPIFLKLPKEINRPNGENSPSLVTLVTEQRLGRGARAILHAYVHTYVCVYICTYI